MNLGCFLNKLFFLGHEIAVHTISHRTPIHFWRNAKRRELIKEIVGMKRKLEKAGIDNVVGYRNPFLQTAGDRTFKILHKYGFVYDSTLPVSFGKLYWPFTLDGGYPLYCVIEPCPKRKITNSDFLYSIFVSNFDQFR